MAADQPSLGLEEMLDQAIGFHQQGRIVEAERLYRQVLNASPEHFDGRHLLGMLRSQQGRHHEALLLIEGALRKKPDDPDALYNCGNVLAALERYDDALVRYNAALAVRADFAEALFNRGNALRAAWYSALGCPYEVHDF
jgi:tetratricopeptide (TPR) repeat protein